MHQSYGFILSANGKIVSEDINPTLHKLSIVSDGFVLQNVTGIRTHIVRRLDGKGYDVTKRANPAISTLDHLLIFLFL